MSNDRMRIGMTPAQLPANPAASRKDASARAAQEAKTVAPVQAAPEPQKVEAVAQRLESYLRSVNRSLEFRVDAASGRTVVSVRDAETGDLIRQIPGDEVLRLAEMAEDQTIVLVDESV